MKACRDDRRGSGSRSLAGWRRVNGDGDSYCEMMLSKAISLVVGRNKVAHGAHKIYFQGRRSVPSVVS